MHSTLTNLQEWSTLAEANMFHSLPSPTISNTFKPLVKDLFIFPSWHLFAIGVKHIFSCRWNLPPVLRSSPKERDSRNKAPCTTTCTWHTGLKPSWMFFSKKLSHAPLLVTHVQKTIQGKRPQFPCCVCPCSFAITHEIPCGFGSSTYLYA